MIDVKYSNSNIEACRCFESSYKSKFFISALEQQKKLNQEKKEKKTDSRNLISENVTFMNNGITFKC